MKFTWKEIFETMIRELSYQEIWEIKKAILAYDLDLQDVYNSEDRIGEVADKLLDYYLNSDDCSSFVNSQIVDYFENTKYIL